MLVLAILPSHTILIIDDRNWLCVLQVWFQNRRSKDRRMKQLTALGVRRQFFRGPHRFRPLRPGDELVDANGLYIGHPAFGYFAGWLLELVSRGRVTGFGRGKFRQNRLFISTERGT